MLLFSVCWYTPTYTSNSRTISDINAPHSTGEMKFKELRIAFHMQSKILLLHLNTEINVAIKMAYTSSPILSNIAIYLKLWSF